ncbi:hypothetical protein TNCV_4634271 [Trichonephila clavipes]|nr:hypothetical protein TNCV_4634271 [Trichonephila clavipes]
MSRSGGQSEVRHPVFKSPNKLGTHLSTHCSRDERLSRPCPARFEASLIDRIYFQQQIQSHFHTNGQLRVSPTATFYG